MTMPEPMQTGSVTTQSSLASCKSVPVLDATPACSGLVKTAGGVHSRPKKHQCSPPGPSLRWLLRPRRFLAHLQARCAASSRLGRTRRQSHRRRRPPLPLPQLSPHPLEKEATAASQHSISPEIRPLGYRLKTGGAPENPSMHSWDFLTRMFPARPFQLELKISPAGSIPALLALT